MLCDKCSSNRVMEIQGKCSDMFELYYKDYEHLGYVKDELNIGCGDYIELSYCLDCGKIQGKFPINEIKVREILLLDK